ncbi:hypothetical protein ES703_76399 [subsurface metagenome]
MDPNHGRDPSIMFWISFKTTLPGPSCGPASAPYPSIDKDITLHYPCPIFCHVDGDPAGGKIKERFGARNISSYEIIYLYIIEELDRHGPHATPPPTQGVYSVYLYLWLWPRWLAPVADVMYHYSLCAPTAGHACLVPQSFRGRASNRFLHLQGLEYFSLQRSRTSIKVAGRAFSVLLRSTGAITVSFTINGGTSKPVSTQGYTTYEIVDYFNVVVLWSIEVMQVCVILFSVGTLRIWKEV